MTSTTGDQALTVDLAGERHDLRPPGALTFGRAAELVIDDANPYLHRIVGRFIWHGAAWWLENLGSTIELELLTPNGPVSRLPPPQTDGTPVVVALTAAQFQVRFTAGGLPYELLGILGEMTLPSGDVPLPAASTETAGYGSITLTEDERMLLLMLAEPCLRDPTTGPNALPTNRVVAENLGWPQSKFNRKLDYLCARLTRAGVRGLQGRRGEGRMANDRRWKLVEHAINARLVKPADLADLTHPPPTLL